jgi:1-acyl-sn-glycerol-3-phosphate acyltransferase
LNPAKTPPLLLFRLFYALYAWPVFLLLGTAALPFLLLLPSLGARRTLVRRVAATALWLIGMRVRAINFDGLPHPCVVVANHESYLDGVVMAATLPPRFGFVIKREMRAVPGAGWLLERIGAQFVARNNVEGSARDALRVFRTAARGEALAFFPEGTFHREPGLLPFHNGAFAAAKRCGSPLIPVVIQGTRHCLQPGTLAPWPGEITLTALPAVPTLDMPSATALRDSTREIFLQHLPT